jgi:hypothetical protein
MRSHILLTIAIGAGIGSLATFLVMRDADTASHLTEVVTDSPRSAERADRDTSTDPFETSEALEATEDASDYPIKLMDMTDPIQRDICISFWYLGMSSVVETLETQTGHKFKPVAKMSAGPVEILEEQAAFMKEFLAETERLGNNE